MANNVVRHPQWPPQPPQCGCGDPSCDGSCGCGPSLPNWSGGFLSCWNQMAQMENVFSTIVKRLIMDPSSGVMDAITKAIVDSDVTGGGLTGSSVVISATTPGNPVTGMQWWNGSIMQVYDGVEWKTVGPSAAAGPVPTTTRVFSLTQAAAMSALTASTWTIVPFNANPTIDTEQGWNAATRQYKPTKAGIYQFLCRWPTGDVALPKNDTGTFTGNEMWVAITTTTGATGWQGITGLTVMNGTTDFVRMYALATTAYAFPGNSGMPLFEAWLMA